MARPIDADILKPDIACHKQYTDQKYKADRQWAIGYNAGIERALFSITYARTMTLEPEPMEWISMAKPEAEAWRECSACGAEVKGIAFPFCPYCGRKARNGVKEND